MDQELLKKCTEIAQIWATSPVFDAETKKEVKAMLEAEDKSQLIDAFYQTLEFGTGGLRGIMGAGTNRMNKYIVGAATQGFANYINKAFPEGGKSVVVGHDCRNNGRMFAETVANIFSANGIKVFLFENVDGFTFKTYQEPMAFVKERSESLGYNITYKVVNAANYGVPQTRKRFICVGVKKELGEFVFPKETHSESGEGNTKKWVTCGEVLADFDNITEEEKSQRPGSKDYELLLKVPPGDNYL